MWHTNAMKKISKIRLAVAVLTLFFSLVGVYSCKKQVFFAPSDADLRIIAEVSTIELNGSVRISIQGYHRDGSLLWDGTRVDLTIENGTLDVDWVELEDGAATVTATGNMNRGEMKITARSGSARATPNPLVVNVGQQPTISRIVASLNPATLPTAGGRVEIVVTVYDRYLQPVPRASVILEASVGTLRSRGAPLVSNNSGQVVDYLDTDKASVVTIYAGDQTHTVNVSLADAPEPNTRPTAEFSFSPSSPVNDETTYFNASGSYDSDGTITAYHWDFGDGTYATGRTTTHAFNVGEYSSKAFVVTLTVYDDAGGWDAISKEITVNFK